MTHTQSKMWDYDPKEIEKLLNQLPRGIICKQLGVSLYTLNNYIKTHQIQYTPPKKAKPQITRKRKTESEKPKRIRVDNSVYVEVKNPLERFKEQFEERKRKGIIRELKDGYY